MVISRTQYSDHFETCYSGHFRETYIDLFDSLVEHKTCQKRSFVCAEPSQISFFYNMNVNKECNYRIIKNPIRAGSLLLATLEFLPARKSFAFGRSVFHETVKLSWKPTKFF